MLLNNLPINNLPRKTSYKKAPTANYLLLMRNSRKLKHEPHNVRARRTGSRKDAAQLRTRAAQGSAELRTRDAQGPFLGPLGAKVLVEGCASPAQGPRKTLRKTPRKVGDFGSPSASPPPARLPFKIEWRSDPRPPDPAPPNPPSPDSTNGIVRG